MSSNAIAVVAASISAVCTAANMAASWSTYRRARPRAEVTSHWLIFGAHEWEDPMGVFLVDITNQSQSEIRVRDLFLRIELTPQTIMPIDEPCHVVLDVIKGDKDEAIPPMGGIDLQVEAKEMMAELIPYIKRVRVEVILTNKSKMVSKWMTKKSQVWVTFDDLVEVVKAHAIVNLGWEPSPNQQLSFDELEETE
ncbi:hypothetical protein ACFY3M_03495 [Streptomyces mirabilis]|uniref:hypothetical protein n=1 Tax=Streptomyces mirabilis TaxID=68239 RepID=UPI00368A133F